MTSYVFDNETYHYPIRSLHEQIIADFRHGGQFAGTCL